MFAQVQSYKPALSILNKVDADVITFESCSSGGMDLEAIGKEMSLVQGTNMVRKEHGIKEAECIAADPKLTLLDIKK